VRQFLYVVEHPDATGIEWPVSPADMTAANKLPLASLNITAGDLFKIDVVDYSGEVVDTEVGEQGGKGWQHTLEFRIAQNKAQKLGFLRLSTNGRLVFFAPCNDGTIRIVGNDILPATRAEASNTTAKKVGDAPGAGQMQKWESYGPGPALIFDGVISDLEALL
jgi:hypothetical protein